MNEKEKSKSVGVPTTFDSTRIASFVAEGLRAAGHDGEELTAATNEIVAAVIKVIVDRFPTSLRIVVSDANAPVDLFGNKSDRDAISRQEKISGEFVSVFWPRYPHKVGKVPAEKAWSGARKQATCEEIMDGLGRYIQAKPATQSWLNPATFLNQQRWKDQPAPITPSRSSDKASGEVARMFKQILSK